MFPKMRRIKQELPLEECLQILGRNTAGVLGTCGTEGYPYAVPLSYVYLRNVCSVHGEGSSQVGSESKQLGRIVFHCSLKGHKINALRENPRASFCVIDQDVVIPEEFATHYKSVIAFGTASFVDDEAEKRALLTELGAKYSPGLDTEAQEEIDRFIRATCVIAIDVERLSGKQAKGLTG